MVIAARSQGTLISAELLRYLHHEPGCWPFDARTRVFLLSLGCPLRLLRGLRSSHLYAWGRYQLPPGTASIGARKPDPDELGVALWVDAYRKGNHVGRHLWIGDDDPGRWDTQTPAEHLAVATDAPMAASNGVDVRRAPNASNSASARAPIPMTSTKRHHR